MHDGKDEQIEQEDAQQRPGMFEALHDRVKGAAEHASETLKEQGERLKEGFHQRMEQTQDWAKEHGKEAAAAVMHVITIPLMGYHSVMVPPTDVSEQPKHVIESSAPPSTIEALHMYHAEKHKGETHKAHQDETGEMPELPEEVDEPKWRRPEPPEQEEHPKKPKR